MTDVILWYVWMQAFALCGWLIASNWLTQLPDRGYGIGKALGVFLGGYIYWITVSLGLAGNEPGAVLLSLTICVVVWLLFRQWNRSRQSVSKLNPPSRLPSLSVIAWTEVIFALAFILCAIYRAYNPDIVEAGGEKFMESMYLNSILRSPTFPPNDAWLSGFSISYYYFGYVILAMFTHVSGIAPAIAFNLGGAMFFALAAVSAFSIGCNLWALYRKSVAGKSLLAQGDTGNELNRAQQGRAPATAYIAGLLTLTMLCLMGNLGGFMESLRCSQLLPQSFWVWLDVRHIESKPVECNALIPTRFYWWWDWSRVIHDYTPTGADQEVISEFPIFSTLLGDNHPHVMNVPFVILAMSMGVHFLSGSKTNNRTDNPDAQSGETAISSKFFQLYLDNTSITSWLIDHGPDIVLSAIVLGGLAFMNTWDFPVYGALVMGAILVGRWHDHQPLLPGAVLGAIPLALGYLFYLPFYLTFASQARGIGINLFNGTRFVQYFIMFAPFLLTLVGFLWYTGRKGSVRPLVVTIRAAGIAAGMLILAVVGALLIGLLSSQSRAYLVEMLSAGSVEGVSRDTVLRLLMNRVTNPWVPVFLAVCLAFSILLVLTRSSVTPGQASKNLYERFIGLLFLFGAALSIAVEFIYLQDLFGTRMNTVFKFYYQSWIIWAVAGAFAIMALMLNGSVLMKILSGVTGLFIVAGLLFPLYAIPAKADFAQPPTLDGSAYLDRTQPDDARIIRWLNQSVKGAPVIAESPGDHYAAYTYSGRISAFTGLPTLLGWGGHEHQWRGNYDEPGRREALIDTLFNTTDQDTMKQVIKQYNVQYVIVGEQERSRYTPQGLAKFANLCSVAFHSGNSDVFKCG